MESSKMYQSSFSKWYNYYFDEVADKRVRDWPLMAGPEKLLAILAVYLMAIYIILPNFMKYKKPYSLKTVIFYYNIIQIIICSTLIVAAIMNGWYQSKITLIGCTPPDYSNDPMAVNLLKVVYSGMLLKILDLSETIFFVLRKKQNQVSFLHVYHHTSTAILGWLVTKYIGGGMMTFALILNCFIHVLMYTYYTLASLGPEWQKRAAPWKSRLTAAQLIQFAMLIAHSLQAAAPSCPVPKLTLILYIPNVILISNLFYNFYKQNYIRAKNQKAN